jgi:thiamine pyrophosphate-dependent acetolactate synthase large subunit-like protein
MGIQQIRRIDALETIAREFPRDPVVLTCGATSREMAHVARGPNHLYVVDSMGLVSSIALGLALSLEGTAVGRCVAVEGDGGMLMNMNALSSIGYLQPKKLLLVVLDNESYASTGGQPTFTERLDLASIAGSCGLRTWRAHDQEGLGRALASAVEVDGPAFVNVKIARGNATVPLLVEDPVVLGHTFTSWLRMRIAA